MQDRNLRILVVDDDDVDREQMVRLLKRIGPSLQFAEARSLEEARACLKTGPFDCVLLDYHLGGAIGLDLVPDVAAHRPEVCPIILVTMRQTDVLIVEAIRSGVADYIPKADLGADRLLRVMRNVMTRAAIEEQRRASEEQLRRMTENMREDYEDTLLAAADRAEANARAKALFVANMSHEIRTPLNTIIGLAYLLSKTRLDPAQADLVGKIGLASKTLLAVVNNVLDSSKLGAHRVAIEHVPFSLAELFDNLRDMVELQIASRPVRLITTIARDVPEQVVGDPTRLHQILLNLLTNAIKFTESGEVSLSVHLGADHPAGPHLHFVVADTGIGIAPDALERLFAPFEQADEAIARTYGGTGLGLSISRELVALMGGTIGATSEPGAGSRFSIDLPFEPCSLPAGHPFEPAGDTGEPRLKGIRLLLVDDCDINLDIAARILEIEGACVATAGNGAEAVEYLLDEARQPVDIVLMDLQMPVFDGIEAFHRIEAALGDKRPPVLALTADVQGANGNAVDIGGMDGIIAKPFDVEQLIETVRRHVRGQGGSQTAAAPPPAAAEPEWPEIPAIDDVDARAHFDGEQGRFLAALARLLEEFRDVPRLPGGTDRAAQVRRLRRLKGMSAMIGARALQAAAEAAQNACADDDPQAVSEALARVVDEFRQLKSQAIVCLVPGRKMPSRGVAGGRPAQARPA